MAANSRYRLFERAQDLIAVLRGIWFLLVFDDISGLKSKIKY